MFIANIAYERAKIGEPQYKPFGKVWYDSDQHKCSILLNGWRQGQSIAKPYSKVTNAPYINGDISIFSGEYEDNGLTKKKYLWCGFIWTESNQQGVVYQIILEIDPTPLMVCKQIKQYHEDTHQNKQEFLSHTGMFLQVFLTDKDEKKVAQPEQVEDDNIPF